MTGQAESSGMRDSLSINKEHVRLLSDLFRDLYEKGAFSEPEKTRNILVRHSVHDVVPSGFNESPVSIHLDPKCRDDRCVFESLKIVVYAFHRSQKFFRLSYFASSKAIQGHSPKLAHGI